MINWPSLLGGKWPLVGWLNRLLMCSRSSEVIAVSGNGILKEDKFGKTIVILEPRKDSFPPFRIYPGSTWLKAKVATGPILTTGDLIVPSNIDTDLDLTISTEKNWIYVDLTATTATFATSATLPTWAGDKIPIGYVDTTDSDHETQMITQIRKEHIFNHCIE